MSYRIRRAIARALAFALPALLLASPSRAVAQADPLADLGDPVELVNAPYRAVPDAERAELALLPAIAAMDGAPEAAGSLRDAILLTPAIAGWAEADAWAGGAPQQAALEALRTVTAPDSRFRFALLYGAEDAEPELRETGYLPRLTEGRLLAGASMRHLEGLDLLLALVAVEAERLAAGGDANGAADLFMRAVRLARMLAERSFFAENHWAMRRMAELLEAIRDIVYRYPDAVTSEGLLAIVERASEENLRIDRILLPEADRLAALQLVRETYERFGQPNLDRFAPTMAVIANVDRPLARFGEASWWRRVGEGHAGYYDSIDAINSSYNDWSLRWTLSAGDPVLDSPTHYERLDPARFAAVRAVLADFVFLKLERANLHVAQRGTRTALAVMAYKASQGVYPKPLFAIRPRYIRTLPLDPFDPRAVDPFQYFVPIRDQPRGEREAPRPHEMQVVGETGLTSALRSDLTVRASRSDAEFASRAREYAQFAIAVAESAGAGDLAQQFRELGALVLRNAGAEDATALLDASFDESLARSATDRRVLQLAAQARREGSLTPAESRELFGIVFGNMINALIDKTIASLAESDPGAVFTVSLDESVFVLYSIGVDERSGFATSVGPGGADILLWPPVISLERDRLVELGRLGG